ncbi:MAG: hypothetical protein P4M11_15505, partial [Candidatus Pacebacteria bacterium]|nr:hypothetical protein [Candidatus Paceibacterota bacterium]
KTPKPQNPKTPKPQCDTFAQIKQYRSLSRSVVTTHVGGPVPPGVGTYLRAEICSGIVPTSVSVKELGAESAGNALSIVAAV